MTSFPLIHDVSVSSYYLVYLGISFSSCAYLRLSLFVQFPIELCYSICLTCSCTYSVTDDSHQIYSESQSNSQCLQPVYSLVSRYGSAFIPRRSLPIHSLRMRTIGIPSHSVLQIDSSCMCGEVQRPAERLAARGKFVFIRPYCIVCSPSNMSLPLSLYFTLIFSNNFCRYSNLMRQLSKFNEVCQSSVPSVPSVPSGPISHHHCLFPKKVAVVNCSGMNFNLGLLKGDNLT